MSLSVLSRGVGAVAIASTLVFAVPVTAQAFDVGQAARVTTGILGGVGAASPGVLAAAGTAEAGAVAATAVTCAASVICGGAVLAIAVGTVAYATKDTWVPWVKSWANDDAPIGGGPGYLQAPGYRAYPLDGTSPSVQFRIQYDGASWGGPFIGGGYNVEMVAEITCQSGAVVTVGAYAWGDGGSAYFQPSIPNPTGDKYWTAQTPCLAGGNGNVVTGYRAYAKAGDGGQWVSRNYGVPDLTWGDSSAPVQRPSDSTVTTNKVCQRPDGSTYTDTRSASNVTDYIPVGYCAPGDKAISLDVVVTPVSGSPIVTQTIPLTPTLADVQAYPLCASAGCEYQILLDGVPCKVGMIGCTTWAATYAATPARVTGRYGPYEYSPSLLGWLTHAYDSSTGTKIGPGTATGGQEAGEPVPEVGVQPPSLTDPLPIPPGTAGAECWPTGIARWNPGDWVLAPVKCALSWAFVPQTATLTAVASTAKADLTRVGIAPLAGAVGGIFPQIPDSSGCLGPAVTFSAVGVVEPLHPFSACEAPMSTLAGISHAVATVGIIGIGGFAALRAVGAGFGFNVSMGRGKADSA